MKIARFEIGGRIAHGILEDEDRLRVLAGSPFETLEVTEEEYALGEVRLLAPVAAPRVFGVGLNYVSHAKESGQKPPEIPMLFMKPTTAVIGPGEPIVYPREGQNVHFEGELAAVIGRTVRRVSEAEALDCVLGYTCADDVSERVIQHREMGMGCLLIGKAFDTFCPLGPVIATGLDPTDLDLEARVNREVRQSINTSDLLFSVAKLVSYLSVAITLLPGDVIITGTPHGVGPITPGDEVEIEISGIGVLRNGVIAET